MLRVDIRELQEGSVATDGVLAADDPALAGLGAVFAAPVEVSGVLTPAAGDSFRWEARLQTTIAGECRRCLTPVDVPIDDAVDLMFSSDPDLLEDPGVYDLPADAVTLDVTQAVREEIGLRVSVFPLCRPDCKGLCPTCGADLNAGPCGCAVPGSTR